MRVSDSDLAGFDGFSFKKLGRFIDKKVGGKKGWGSLLQGVGAVAAVTGVGLLAGSALTTAGAGLSKAGAKKAPTQADLAAAGMAPPGGQVPAVPGQPAAGSKSVAGPLVGAGAGFLVAGPVGALVGLAAGSMIKR